MHGFNPHTHEGCDLTLQHEKCKSVVSIHTPTKGVTNATLCITRRITCFNPHTHEGCDNHIKELLEYIGVSIHTPTKGVT